MISDKFKVFKSFLTKEDCNEIIEKCLSELHLTDGKVYNNIKTYINVDTNIRKSKVSKIELEKINKTVFDILNTYFKIKGCKFNVFKYQFSHYEVGDYFEWHTDSNDTMYNQRFLTIVIQLNDEYEGGEFEIQIDDKIFELESGIGNLFVFPSTTKHRIKQITKGNRYSIVNWIQLEQIKNYEKTLI